MQVISFMAIKGGVGKTTMAFQFAKYLQENNKSTRSEERRVGKECRR